VSKRFTVLATIAVLAVAGTLAPSAAALGDPGGGSSGNGQPSTIPGGFKHLVVIYEENHSFDNLYGGWGAVNGQEVNGTQSVPQIAQDGSAYACLPQVDVNLTSPPLPVSCTDTAHGIASAFTNHTFTIDDYIAPTDTTCPPPGVFAANGVPKGSGQPGGCTRDLVHRFYEDQYQENGGLMNRYTTGSDAVGLTQGQYDTTKLPIYQYLHSAGAPNYVLAQMYSSAITTSCKDGKITRAELRKNFAKVSLKSTILGTPIRFTANGDLAGAKFHIFKIVNGKYETVQ